MEEENEYEDDFLDENQPSTVDVQSKMHDEVPVLAEVDSTSGVQDYEEDDFEPISPQKLNSVENGNKATSTNHFENKVKIEQERENKSFNLENTNNSEHDNGGVKKIRQPEKIGLQYKQIKNDSIANLKNDEESENYNELFDSVSDSTGKTAQKVRDINYHEKNSDNQSQSVASTIKKMKANSHVELVYDLEPQESQVTHESLFSVEFSQDHEHNDEVPSPKHYQHELSKSKLNDIVNQLETVSIDSYVPTKKMNPVVKSNPTLALTGSNEVDETLLYDDDFDDGPINRNSTLHLSVASLDPKYLLSLPMNPPLSNNPIQSSKSEASEAKTAPKKSSILQSLEYEELLLQLNNPYVSTHQPITKKKSSKASYKDLMSRSGSPSNVQQSISRSRSSKSPTIKINNSNKPNELRSIVAQNRQSNEKIEPKVETITKIKSKSKKKSDDSSDDFDYDTFLTSLPIPHTNVTKKEVKNIHQHPPQKQRPSSGYKLKCTAATEFDLLLRLDADKNEGQICIHNRSLLICQDILCRDSQDKYKWLTTIRKKIRPVMELILEADRLWREKVTTSMTESLHDLKKSQQQEFLNLKKKSQLFTQNEQLALEIVQNYETIIRNNPTLDDLELLKVTGITLADYQFYIKQIDTGKHHREVRFRAMFDQLKQIHWKAQETMKESIREPLHYLDQVKEKQIAMLTKSLHTIELAFQQSYKLLFYNKANKKSNETLTLMVERSRNLGNVLLKQTLGVVAQICSDIPNLYQGIKMDFLTQSMKGTERSKSPLVKPRSQSAFRTSSPVTKLLKRAPIDKEEKIKTLERAQSAPVYYRNIVTRSRKGRQKHGILLTIDLEGMDNKPRDRIEIKQDTYLPFDEMKSNPPVETVKDFLIEINEDVDESNGKSLNENIPIKGLNRNNSASNSSSVYYGAEDFETEGSNDVMALKGLIPTSRRSSKSQNFGINRMSRQMTGLTNDGGSVIDEDNELKGLVDSTMSHGIVESGSMVVDDTSAIKDTKTIGQSHASEVKDETLKGSSTYSSTFLPEHSHYSRRSSRNDVSVGDNIIDDDVSVVLSIKNPNDPTDADTFQSKEKESPIEGIGFIDGEMEEHLLTDEDPDELDVSTNAYQLIDTDVPKDSTPSPDNEEMNHVKMEEFQQNKTKGFRKTKQKSIRLDRLDLLDLSKMKNNTFDKRIALKEVLTAAKDRMKRIRKSNPQSIQLEPLPLIKERMQTVKNRTSSDYTMTYENSLQTNEIKSKSNEYSMTYEDNSMLKNQVVQTHRIPSNPNRPSDEPVLIKSASLNLDRIVAEMKDLKSQYMLYYNYCDFCHLSFVGEGKSVPNATIKDQEVIHRVNNVLGKTLRRKELNKSKSILSLKELRKIAVQSKRSSVDSDQRRKGMLSLSSKKEVIQTVVNTSDDSNKIFCSWKCLKDWTVEYCPIQLKYEKLLLIDMAAGQKTN